MIKKLISGLIVMSLLSLNISTIFAKEDEKEEGSKIFIYDLNDEEDQYFSYYDHDNGEYVRVSIEKIDIFDKTITNGRYKISTVREGSWSASFEISVTNYKITSAGNAQATALVGSFISKNLIIDNSVMATYYLKRKIGVLATNFYLRAQIENSNLKVIVK